MKSSLRLQQISASVTVALNGKVVEMKARGEDLIALNAGEPDFPTPSHIKSASPPVPSKLLTTPF